MLQVNYVPKDMYIVFNIFSTKIFSVKYILIKRNRFINYICILKNSKDGRVHDVQHEIIRLY